MQAPMVLIVEHEERVSRVLCRIIKRMGYEPFAAEKYKEFKIIYTDKRPEIILLSLDIPGNENSEYFRFLVEQHSRAAIILLSQSDEDETADFMNLGLAAGLNMAGVLRKPIDVESVKELLAEQMPSEQSHPLKKSYQPAQETQTGKQVRIFDPDQIYKTQLCCN